MSAVAVLGRRQPAVAGEVPRGRHRGRSGTAAQEAAAVRDQLLAVEGRFHETAQDRNELENATDPRGESAEGP